MVVSLQNASCPVRNVIFKAAEMQWWTVYSCEIALQLYIPGA